MNGIFKGKVYGAVTIGERGQLVIPADLRKELKLKSGNKLMVFAVRNKRVINLMKEEDFSNLLRRAARIVSKLEDEIPQKS